MEERVKITTHFKENPKESLQDILKEILRIILREQQQQNIYTCLPLGYNRSSGR